MQEQFWKKASKHYKSSSPNQGKLSLVPANLVFNFLRNKGYVEEVDVLRVVALGSVVFVERSGENPICKACGIQSHNPSHRFCGRPI